MPRDLEVEIFGGGESDLSESNLSDYEQDPKPAAASEAIPDGRPQDEDYDGTPAAEDGRGLPRFRKDPSHRQPHQNTTEKRKPQNKNKRQEPQGDQPEEADVEPIIDPEAQRRQELYDRIDEAAGKNKKSKRHRRKGGDEDLEMMADEEVTRLRTRMLNAASTDQEANEEHRPATAKLMLLPLVTSTMQKSHLETAILDNGVLEAVRRWLEPLPDRSLPALNIQRSLLQLLTKMSIDTQSLKASELGRIVLFYTKCSRVDPSIKRLAVNLVTSWMRPIVRRSASYRSRAPLPVAPVPSRPISSTQTTSTSRPSQSQNARSSQRARIPETVHQAFQFAPMSQLDPNHPDGSNGGFQNPALRNSTQKATAKKTREWARKLTDAKKGNRLG